MGLLIGVVVVVLLGIVVAVLPLLLPWPQHLRWMIAANASAQPLQRAGSCDGLVLSEVTVVATEIRFDRIVTWLASAADSQLLVRSLPVSTVASRQLDEWSLDGTPLLFVTTPDGHQTLYARAACVTGLREWEPRPRLEAA